MVHSSSVTHLVFPYTRSPIPLGAPLASKKPTLPNERTNRTPVNKAGGQRYRLLYADHRQLDFPHHAIKFGHGPLHDIAERTQRLIGLGA